MSCSDKVMKWNLLGLQGSLLSLIIEPVYMKSLVLGMLYHHGHLSRSTCCRLEKYLTSKEKLPVRYRINHPRMGRLSSGEPPREARKTKTREFSVNWMYHDDKKLEIVDGTKGCPLDSSDEQVIISRVAPHSLYQQFKKIAPKFNVRIKSCYDDTKKSATDYLIAKNILIKDFSRNGFGKWMHKPEETSGFD